MSKVLREKMSEELVKRLKGVDNMMLVDYRKLTALQAVEFRTQVRKAKLGITVLKNSVGKHAFKELGRGDLAEFLTEMNALVYGPDAVSVAKVIYTFREKNNRIPTVKAAIMDGHQIPAEQVAYLSNLPSKDQMLGHFLATLNAPVSSFVRLLNAIPSGFVQVLAAIKEKKS